MKLPTASAKSSSMLVLHRELWLYGSRQIQFHQAHTSTPLVWGTMCALFDGEAPKTRKIILTKKRMGWGRRGEGHFLILFGSSISRYQALSQTVRLLYQNTQCCLAVLHFLQGKGRRPAGRAPQANNIRSQKFSGLSSPPPPQASHCECLSHFEGQVKSNNRKPTFHYTAQRSQNISEAVFTFLFSIEWRYFNILTFKTSRPVVIHSLFYIFYCNQPG